LTRAAATRAAPAAVRSRGGGAPRHRPDAAVRERDSGARPGDVMLLLHSGLALTLLIQLAVGSTNLAEERSVLPVFVMNGPALPVVVAAALAFGFAWPLPLAKAAEVETARIAMPTMMVFFMFPSLELDARQFNTELKSWSRTEAKYTTSIELAPELVQERPQIGGVFLKHLSPFF
jgi:hypothetical protein